VRSNLLAYRAVQQRWWAWLGVVVILATSGGCRSSQQPGATAPRLLVVVVVDQLKAEYLQRFQSHFTGALRSLPREGAVFTDFQHDYAATDSVVGHATLVSGRYPSHHGFVRTEWLDREKLAMAFVTEDKACRQLDGSSGRSPRNFIGTSLPDWWQHDYPQAKVVTIAGKERAATAMGGTKTSQVFWFSFRHYGFTTSTHYMEQLPEWVARVNARLGARSWAGVVWNPLRDLSGLVSQADDAPFEGDMFGLGRAFPHKIPDSEEDARFALSATPFGDEMTLDLAREAVAEFQMGRDEIPDLLLVSLSANDQIGHVWGPESHEVADQILRVDRWLEEFFAQLSKSVGPSGLLLVVTGDHGVAPIIGSEESKQLNGRWVDVGPALAELTEELKKETGLSDWFSGTSRDSLYLNPNTIKAAGADPALIARRAATRLRSIDGFARVYTRDDLAAITKPRDETERMVLNAFIYERSGDVVWVLEPGCLLHDEFYARGKNVIATHHGTLHEYDTHVPLLVKGPGVPVRSYSRRVSAIDLAPTLARLCGVVPMEALDGKAMPELVKD
jgi:predicted AlkP superfamily pyrophosphatase or phosphodiesterase